MTSKLKYLFLLIKCLIYPILFTLFEIFITYLLSLIGDINSNIMLIINSIICLIFALIVFKIKNKKYNIKYKFNNLKYIPVMAISIALSLNMFIIIINNIFNIENVLNNNILVMTLLSGIIGPIIEEILFRGIVFEELKKFNSSYKSVILCTIIFAIFHNTFIQMIYAFIIGLIILKLYIKTNNFLVCIIFHICANTVISLLFNGLVLLPIYLLIGLGLFFGLEFYYLYKYKN